MPLLHPADHPSFKFSGTSFTGLAAPSRGASETAAWRVRVEPGTPETPHRITREEIIIALAGRARATVDGQLHELETGGTLIVPASSTLALGNPYDAAFEAIAIYPVGGEVVVGSAAPFTPPWAL
ncbi:MAG: cupin domain-containing protein [Gemmatimonadetes bacterium]|nr:cupin domain-containing protein [Gemmatimonadota bacterium]